MQVVILNLEVKHFASTPENVRKLSIIIFSAVVLNSICFADLTRIECVHTGQAEKLLDRDGNRTHDFWFAGQSNALYGQVGSSV